jgi:hypothetical protein
MPPVNFELFKDIENDYNEIAFISNYILKTSRKEFALEMHTMDNEIQQNYKKKSNFLF